MKQQFGEVHYVTERHKGPIAGLRQVMKLGFGPAPSHNEDYSVLFSIWLNFVSKNTSPHAKLAWNHFASHVLRFSSSGFELMNMLPLDNTAISCGQLHYDASNWRLLDFYLKNQLIRAISSNKVICYLNYKEPGYAVD